MAEMTELERMKIQREALELEELADRVETIRSRREARRVAHKRQQHEMEQNIVIEKQRQDACFHKKGGKNQAGFLKGNSPNYSVIKHTYPWGAVQVICTRCAKEWNKPALALKKTDSKQYAADLAEYRAALDWPTDNEPSGTQLFLITENGKVAA